MVCIPKKQIQVCQVMVSAMGGGKSKQDKEKEYRGGWYFIGVAEEGCPDRECLVCGYPGEDIFRQNDPPDRWL